MLLVAVLEVPIVPLVLIPPTPADKVPTVAVLVTFKPPAPATLSWPEMLLAAAPVTVRTPVVLMPPVPPVRVPTLAVFVTVKAVPEAAKLVAPVKALAIVPVWV